MDTSIQVAAMVVIASFVIDRVAGGVFFLLSLFPFWNRWCPDPATVSDANEKLTAQKNRKLLYYSFVALLAAVIVAQFDLRVLDALQLRGVKPGPWQDALFSVLVLMGGSDQVAGLLKSPHAGKAVDLSATQKPIEVTGKLTLDDGGAHATKTSRTAGG